MSFFANLFKKSNKTYVTMDDINHLSNSEFIEKFKTKKKKFLIELGINPAYIDRMIDYIESLYRNNLTIINSRNGLINCINRDCVLFEMIIDLPPLPLEENKEFVYLQLHQNILKETGVNIDFNPGYIWDTYKNLKDITNNKDKYDLLETYGKYLSKYIGFIKVYVKLVDLYTYKRFTKILEDLIFERLKKIYFGLWMMFSKDLAITITYKKDDYIRQLFSSEELDKINLGILYIGYKNIPTSLDNTILVTFDTEYYEKKPLTQLYIDFHNTVRDVEYINTKKLWF